MHRQNIPGGKSTGGIFVTQSRFWDTYLGEVKPYLVILELWNDVSKQKKII